MDHTRLALSALVLLALGSVTAAQEAEAGSPVVGSWQGTLDAGVAKLRLVVHVAGKPGELSAKLDSPDQGATGIPIDKVTFADGIFEFAIDRLRASFKGELDADGKKIAGTFTQGQDFSLELSRVKGEVKPPSRPQHPKKPYPYAVEEVFYGHDPKGDTAATFQVVDADTKAAGRVRLAATLTLPRSAGPHPAVVLISGSGPQDRDETLLGHKPFLVLADALTRRGIAVLRFDDRGTGESTGDFGKAISTDFARDAHAGMLYLKSRKEIDPKKIGLVGHSEGGLIAPLVAANTKDVAFIVMLAGPGVPGDEIIILQSQLIGRARGASAELLDQGTKTNREIFDVIRKGGEATAVRAKVTTILEASYDEMPEEVRKQVGDKGAFVKQRIGRVLTPWFRHFVTYDPAPTLAKVTCPVLVLNGEKDLQVDPGQNLPPIRKALQHNPDVTIVELEGLNHLFQSCETGSTTEYARIEETFAPRALKQIGDWIAKRFL